MAGERWDDPRHFPDQDAFRRWMAENHGREEELWIGFYRKALGKAQLGYPEAVDECLCWGWIDGIRKKVDEERYTNRVTPRREGSWWSEKNRARYAELVAAGRVADPGREARARFRAPFDETAAGKDPDPPDGDEGLSRELRDRFREHPEAWAFHRAQPEGYRRTASRWIADAVRASTRLRRLDKLIRFAAAGERLPEVEGRKTRDHP